MCPGEAVAAAVSVAGRASLGELRAEGGVMGKSSEPQC